ncbi:MAG: hypothetical protein K8U57_27305 [Planctomycetes bacterium]|nr:hypothetical protein [Planctomycetota bacterium]
MSEATRQFFDGLKGGGETVAHEVNSIKEWWSGLHFGAGHADAMIRAGGKELAQALVAFPDSNIRPVEEPGLLGNLTPQEVMRGKDEALGNDGVGAPKIEAPQMERGGMEL